MDKQRPLYFISERPPASEGDNIFIASPHSYGPEWEGILHKAAVVTFVCKDEIALDSESVNRSKGPCENLWLHVRETVTYKHLATRNVGQSRTIALFSGHRSDKRRLIQRGINAVSTIRFEFNLKSDLGFPL